jgi:hypothetical protein
MEEIAAILKQYRITFITGDAFATGFVIEGFRKAGIEYRISRYSKSEAYLGFLPLITSGTVLLLDIARLIAQFAGLERRTLPSGREQVDHELNGHDDAANACALAAVLAAAEQQRIPIVAPIIVSGGPRNVPGSTATSTSQTYPIAPEPGRTTTELYFDWIASGRGDRWGGT